MTDAHDILEAAQEALELQHGTLTSLVHSLARAVVELTARRGDERGWADVAKRTLEAYVAREPEVTALREVERAARDVLKRDDAEWCNELSDAIDALDELRGGTGE